MSIRRALTARNGAWAPDGRRFPDRREKGILVAKSIEYAFIIAPAFPAFALISASFADRMERKQQVAISSPAITPRR
jgi:hypothetical protein